MLYCRQWLGQAKEDAALEEEGEARNGKITGCLRRWREGDDQALDELIPDVYPELRKLARVRLRAQTDGPLTPTELVHEAFLRLADSKDQPMWANRAHFYYIAARLMRQVLVDLAREANALKRGSGAKVLSLDGLHAAAPPNEALAILEIHHALDALAIVDARKARAVELRYFGGLSLEEIATAMDVAVPTVSRDLRAGTAWLRSQMGSER